jgi:hypothetical protein
VHVLIEAPHHEGIWQSGDTAPCLHLGTALLQQRIVITQRIEGWSGSIRKGEIFCTSWEFVFCTSLQILLRQTIEVRKLGWSGVQLTQGDE